MFNILSAPFANFAVNAFKKQLSWNRKVWIRDCIVLIAVANCSRQPSSTMVD